ncbi:hypothetical protein OEZ60_05400 [Defluviimonas sp. WL0024]|uniref:Uncharacterized protein n=2 Tax=Albidovulum TaxID=205889 RepID=A0ABT3J1Q6_9RHOB|nr:hypothetical protein [Defluviimonas sp. WL0024]MCU9847435.1 hypothetical protein [Defluviimonas sp. WL0024]MCW3781627.1 hypothetical protein [Defluviimonas salinarum]
MPELDLTTDHKALDDDLAARRYFAKFERITRLLGGVAEAMEKERGFSAMDGDVLDAYVRAIAATFKALSLKYLVSGRLEGIGQKHLTIDLHESGFPIYQELVTMANDAAQAARHLEGMADAGRLKDEMVRQIVGERVVPTRLQYALSQRLYYEVLQRGGLYFAQMHPKAEWIADVTGGRRGYLVHWGTYDSQLNVPVVYLMEVVDSGRKALPLDERRWPAVQAHLMAQSVGGLKLLTIAKGFDTDFDDLHPKRLRRLHLGPMYSSAFTLQTGPIREVLEEAKSPKGEDWALAWTVEELESERVEVEKGWFSEVEREVFRLDPFAGRGVDTGATRVTRSLILPQRPFQVLAEKDPAGFRDVRKFVVGKEGRVLVYG